MGVDMNGDEVRILSIIDGSMVDDFVEKACLILDMDQETVRNIVSNFEQQELVTTMSLVNGEMYAYAYHVDRSMLDQDLYSNYGQKPLIMH